MKLFAKIGVIGLRLLLKTLTCTLVPLFILAFFAVYFVVRKIVRTIVSNEIAQPANAFNSMKNSLLKSFLSLMDSEERFRTMVQNMPVMINAFDENWNFVVWNNECVKVTGYSADEIVDNPNAMELLYPDAGNREYIQTKWINSSNSYRDWELQIACKNGSLKTISWSNISRQFSIAGWKRWIVGVDITKRKQLKFDLVEKTIYLDSILRSSSEIAIVATGIDYNIKYYSPMAEKIFEYKSEDVIGKTILDIQDKINMDPACFETAIGKIHNESEHSFIIEQKKVNKIRFIQVRISGIFDINSSLVGFVLMAQDISERIEAERDLRKSVDELARSNEELEQFAYVASHDLQEPLRMIVSYLQLLERRYKGKFDKNADDFIGYAVDGASRMQELINDILSYSRVGTHGEVFEPVDCRTILDKALINLQPGINKSGAKVAYDKLPTVVVDKSQMVQLFQNLIGNAIKFCKNKTPEIEISAERKGDEWVFSVRDNGIGIEHEQFKRVFLMFQRLHSRSEYPGTGIGLAICKKIVERHSGRIWIESEPRKGATFFFTIPWNIYSKQLTVITDHFSLV